MPNTSGGMVSGIFFLIFKKLIDNKFSWMWMHGWNFVDGGRVILDPDPTAQKFRSRLRFWIYNTEYNFFMFFTLSIKNVIDKTREIG
jgi:hypothetical protein